MSNDDLEEFGLADAEPGPQAPTAAPAPPTAAQAPDYWKDILGDAAGGAASILDALKGSPAFQAAAAQRLANSRPAIRPPVRAQDYQLAFVHKGGKKGEVVSIVARPQHLFRGEKLVCTDTSPNPGHGTVMQSMFIGQKNQFPQISGGIPSSAFAANNLGRGIKMDTCQPALQMTMVVEFLVDCDFYGTIFGKAVV